MADIFVSYRRDDSQWPAGGINERLEAVFGAGRVFFDTVTIRPGENFREVLGAKVGACKVLLVVIGPRWLDILEGRLGDTNDFVRIEIAEGLRRKVCVIPVLIDGAKPPPEARLPDDLKALAWHHAIPVRADTFRSDLDRLIGFLKGFLESRPAAERPLADMALTGKPVLNLAPNGAKVVMATFDYADPGPEEFRSMEDLDPVENRPQLDERLDPIFQSGREGFSGHFFLLPQLGREMKNWGFTFRKMTSQRQNGHRKFEVVFRLGEPQKIPVELTDTFEQVTSRVWVRFSAFRGQSSMLLQFDQQLGACPSSRLQSEFVKLNSLRTCDSRLIRWPRSTRRPETPPKRVPIRCLMESDSTPTSATALFGQAPSACHRYFHAAEPRTGYQTNQRPWR